MHRVAPSQIAREGIVNLAGRGGWEDRGPWLLRRHMRVPVSGRDHRPRGLALLPVRPVLVRCLRADARQWRSGLARNNPTVDPEVRTGLRQRPAAPTASPGRQVAHGRDIRQDQRCWVLPLGEPSIRTGLYSTSWCSAAATQSRRRSSSASCSKAAPTSHGCSSPTSSPATAPPSARSYPAWSIGRAGT